MTNPKPQPPLPPGLLKALAGVQCQCPGCGYTAPFPQVAVRVNSDPQPQPVTPSEELPF